ncbi:MAG: hypothetical protein R2730_02265 [Chitinophagales bacterium]
MSITVTSMEILSGYLLKNKYSDTLNKVRYNRTLSGYTIFENTPNFSHQTYNNGSNGLDIVTDSNGYICNRPNRDDQFLIFINGGSGAMGAGQSPRYNKLHQYPTEIYSFELSIAGILQSKLDSMFPNKYVKVVNAASYTKTMHQSYIEYITKISKLDIDMIIQIDGFNDLGPILSGHPANFISNLWLDYYVGITYSNPNITPSSTLNLLYDFFKHKGKHTKISYRTYAYDNNDKEDYKRSSSKYKTNSRRFIQLLDYYANTLSKDSVSFLYCIQPILNRTPNKVLTEKESAFANLNPLYDDMAPEEITSFIASYDEENGIILKQSMLALKYFYTDFMSDEIEQTINKNKGHFIDLGMQITQVDGNVDVYTDYCHLTQSGNNFVAEQLVNIIIQNELISNDIQL